MTMTTCMFSTTTMKRLLALCSSLALTATVTAAEFHVAPTGNDTNPGAADKPFATLEKARDAARANPGADTILVHGGTYWMDKPLVLTSADSGITITAITGEKPVLSGGQRISGWQPLANTTSGVANAAKGKLWVAEIPKGWRFHYLFVGGESMPRAKLPNEPFKLTIALNGRQPTTLKPSADGRLAVLTLERPINETVEWRVDFR